MSAASASTSRPNWPNISLHSGSRRTDTVLELSLGDVVRLRKVHPCGGFDWQVTRLGADIGLRCLTCGRRVLLERPTLEKRIKAFVFRAGSAAQTDESISPR